MTKAAGIHGKVVVITGGARGIGLATATTLRKLGAEVAVGDVDETTLKESATAADIPVYGKLDVTDSDSFAAFLDDVERQLGPIDVLINNAGIMPAGKLIDEPDAVTRRILDINVYGVIVGTKLATRRMLARRHGHIINIASIAGELPSAGLASYCASKFAVLGFTESMRREYRASGVTFSTVLPTITNTELASGIHAAKGLRNAEPQEIADAIVRLIAKPKPRVTITRLAGAVVASGKRMPARANDWLESKFGMDRIFLDEVDQTARRAYEERARGD